MIKDRATGRYQIRKIQGSSSNLRGVGLRKVDSLTDVETAELTYSLAAQPPHHIKIGQKKLLKVHLDNKP